MRSVHEVTRSSLGLAAAGIALGASLACPAALASTTGRAVTLGANLLVNPGAEAGAGATSDAVVPVLGWTGAGGFTVEQYGWLGVGSDDADLTPTTPGPAARGKNYFCVGSYSPIATGTQVVSLGGLKNTSAYRATLKGWLGGFDGQDDNAVVTAYLLGPTGRQLGSFHIGPALSAARGGLTSQVQRSAAKTLPAGVASIKVVMTMTRVSGNFNDGNADNLSLVLTKA
jgi:hypothetical protein